MEHLWLIPLGIIGLFVSYYINKNKKAATPMVCLPGQDCNAVVNSKYGKTLGIENALLGFLYYGFIFGIGITEFFAPAFVALIAVFVVKLVASGGSFLFSLYLTYVQGAVLKDWCPWCIASAITSTLIFIVIIF